MEIHTPSPQETQALLTTTPTAVYFDVRTVSEFSSGHPKGKTVNIPIVFHHLTTKETPLNPSFLEVVRSLEMQASSRQSLASNLLIIDGFNVLHAGILVGRDRAEWWKEAAQRRLVERVERFSDPTYEEIWIVFDRREEKEGAVIDVTSNDPRIRVSYAPSADDWIVEQVRTLSGQQSITVVTADRPLRDRTRHAGGTLCSPMQFLTKCV